MHGDHDGVVAGVDVVVVVAVGYGDADVDGGGLLLLRYLPLHRRLIPTDCYRRSR